ncbi:MAG: amino acid ABC transporter permease [Bacillota bacterium]
MLEFFSNYLILDIFISNFPRLLDGLKFTLSLTVVVMFFGTVFGVLLAFGRAYGNKPIAWLSTAYIELIRGTPMLAQLFILYFALPPYGINMTAVTVAYLGFTINCAAYQAEYTRGSIESIGADQYKSAYSLGMSRWKTIVYIVLPQAIRLSIPAWTNELIYILKYTSLAYIIGAPDLMTQGKFIASRNYQFFRVYFIIAIIYLIIVLSTTKLIDVIEEKYKIPGFGYEERKY